MHDNDLVTETTRLVLELENKKSRLINELQCVEKELSDARARHARLVNLTVPVSQLPDELLVDIFQLCLHDDSLRKHGPAFKVTASHVSTRWRNVVLNLPLLWNTIQLDINPKTLKRALHRLLAHLSRSRDCLLDISLNISVHPDSLAVILNPLLPHAYKWRSVSISIAKGSAEDIYTPFCSIAAPHLIHLSLGIGNPHDETDSPRTEYPDICPTILSQGCMSLNFVRVAGKIVGNLCPPLNTVTTFHVDAWPKNLMTLTQFRAMLDSLPCLVNLSLTGLSIHLPRNPLDTTKPVLLPALRSFRIRGNSTPCHRLLSMLTLPQLEFLSLHGIDTFGSDVISSLHSLTLEACILTELELLEIMRAFPRVTTLDIDDSIPDIYSLMVVQLDGTTPTWPRLRTMQIRALRPSDSVTLCLVILSRSSSDSPIHSIHLSKQAKSVLSRKTLLDGMAAYLSVESTEMAPWPVYLGYEDLHDVWY